MAGYAVIIMLAMLRHACRDASLSACLMRLRENDSSVAKSFPAYIATHAITPSHDWANPARAA